MVAARHPQLSVLAGSCGGLLLVAFLVGCSESSDTAECLTDLSTPTATLEVATDESEGAKQFLTAGSAVVQTDFDTEATVMGVDAGLQDALDGSRVLAVAPKGYLVQEIRDDPEEASELRIIDPRGVTVLDGPAVGPISRAQVLDDQFLVIDDDQVLAYDLDTGEPVEQAFKDPAGSKTSIASSIVLTANGTFGGVLDTRSGEEFAIDDLLDLGAEGALSVAGSGTEQVVIASRPGDGTTTYWTWSAAAGPREIFTSATIDSAGSPGVCDDLFYLAEDDELRVVDTTVDPTADEVVASRPYTVGLGGGSGYSVLAIPGGLLLTEVDGPAGLTRYTWFD